MKVRIGIMSEELIRIRLLAIAQGKYQPKKNEPKMWFTSINAISQLLRPENLELLRLIQSQKPESLTQLAELTGRAKSNLSNTLKNLSDKGFVRLEPSCSNSLKPVAIYTDFEIVTDLKLENKLHKIAADQKAA